jgi:TonB family protein
MRKPTAAVLAFCCSASLLTAQSQLPDTASKKVKGNKVRSPTRTADTSMLWVKPSNDQVYADSVVGVRPEFLSGPRLVYPDSLRQAGVQGRVIVQAVLDTMGRAEPWSVKIIQSPHPGFDQPARNFVLGALFRAGRVQERAVRVLVNVPLDFSIPPKH